MQQSAHSAWRKFACLALAFASVMSGGVSRAQSAEYQMKAAVIMGIVKATEWPVAKLKPNAPIIIGVFGPELAADKIRESIAARTIRGRTVVVKVLAAVEEIEGCHVIFAGVSDDATVRKILRHTSGDPILTFGETRAFTERGGIFFLQSDGIRDGGIALRTFMDGRNLKRSDLKIDDEAITAAGVEPVQKR